MKFPINLELIKKRYEFYYKEALNGQYFSLPCYEIEEWDKVLDPVAHRIFQDIKVIGVPLYPIYPLGPTEYLHFANPFNKVGIEIVYKNSSREKIRRKLASLEHTGWKIYETDSRKSYYTFNEYCDFKLPDRNVYELESDDYLNFLDQSKYSNTGCLLHFIKLIHFEDFYYGEDDHPLTSMEEILNNDFKNYFFRVLQLNELHVS